MSTTYANLITHSHYSCGNAIGSSKEIILSAKNKQLYSIGITDFSTISGLLDFYNKGSLI